MRDPTSLLQAPSSPVGAFVAPECPSLFLSYSFFLGAGGRAYVFCYACLYPFVHWYAIVFVFCSFYSLRLFFAQHTCFAILSSYPIRPSLPSLPPCLAQLCCATAALGGYSVGAVSVSCPCLSSDLGSERSSLRSRGILLYPLCHKAFEPVDNSVFSVDIYRYPVYNYPYLYSVTVVILSVLSIYYLPMKLSPCYPFRSFSSYPCSYSPCSSSFSFGNGYLQERASLAIQQRTLRLYRSLRARYSLRVLSYLSRAISLLPASFASLRTVALASMQYLSICSINRSLPSVLPQRLTFPNAMLCSSYPDCSSFQSSQSLAKKDSGFASLRRIFTSLR